VTGLDGAQTSLPTLNSLEDQRIEAGINVGEPG